MGETGSTRCAGAIMKFGAVRATRREFIRLGMRR
jgi:hypothetical protein